MLREGRSRIGCITDTASKRENLTIGDGFFVQLIKRETPAYEPCCHNVRDRELRIVAVGGCALVFFRFADGLDHRGWDEHIDRSDLRGLYAFAQRDRGIGGGMSEMAGGHRLDRDFGNLPRGAEMFDREREVGVGHIWAEM